MDECAIRFGDRHPHARHRIFSKPGRRRRTRQNKFGADAKQSRLQSETFGESVQRCLAGTVDGECGQRLDGDAGADVDDNA